MGIPANRSLNLGRGRFPTLQNRNLVLSPESVRKSLRNVFGKRVRSNFAEVIDFFSDWHDLCDENFSSDNVAIKVAYFLRSLLICDQTSSERACQEIPFNKSLVKRLACFIEPEALAQLFACLVLGEEVRQGRGQGIGDLLSDILTKERDLTVDQLKRTSSEYLARAFNETLDLIADENRPSHRQLGFPRARLLVKEELNDIDFRDLATQGFKLEATKLGIWVPLRKRDQSTVAALLQKSRDTFEASEWKIGRRKLQALAGLL